MNAWNTTNASISQSAVAPTGCPALDLIQSAFWIAGSYRRWVIR